MYSTHSATPTRTFALVTTLQFDFTTEWAISWYGRASSGDVMSTWPITFFDAFFAFSCARFAATCLATMSTFWEEFLTLQFALDPGHVQDTRYSFLVATRRKRLIHSHTANCYTLLPAKVTARMGATVNGFGTLCGTQIVLMLWVVRMTSKSACMTARKTNLAGP